MITDHDKINAEKLDPKQWSLILNALIHGQGISIGFVADKI